DTDRHAEVTRRPNTCQSLAGPGFQTKENSDRSAVPTWTEGTTLAKFQDRSRSWGRQSALASSTLFLEHSLADPGARAQNQIQLRNNVSLKIRLVV
ncbi:unnamed protein product, partial [Rangifer tarandus platyrhynchus]